MKKAGFRIQILIFIVGLFVMVLPGFEMHGHMNPDNIRNPFRYQPDLCL